MNSINPHFVEKYQILYEKDPKSKVFAPLAEAYRKMGLIDQAYEIAKKGIDLHPDFASGHLAYAKILLDRKIYDSAQSHLEKTIALSPENIKAHYLLAKTYLRQKQHREATQAFKMLLFLSPNHVEARNQLKKLESLSAEDYEEDFFRFKNINNIGTSKTTQEKIKERHFSEPRDKLRQLDRMLSLADAFLVRNDAENALVTLQKAQEQIGQHPEIQKRFQMLNHFEDIEISEADSQNLEGIRPQSPPTKRREILEKILRRINQRKV